MKLPTSSRIQHGRREAPAARPPPRGRPQQTLNLKTVALLALTTGSCCFAAHLLSNDVFDLVVDESQVMVDLSLKHTHTHIKTRTSTSIIDVLSVFNSKITKTSREHLYWLWFISQQSIKHPQTCRQNGALWVK